MSALATTSDGVRVCLALKDDCCHVVDADGGTGGGDVAGDIRLLQLVLGRVDLDRLDDGRVDGPHDDGHEGPESDAEDRQGPAAPTDVDEEDDGGQERDPDEQGESRHPGVDVGVGRPLDVAVLGEVEVVTGEVVAEGLDQGHAGQEDRDVDLHLGGHARRARLDPDAAVQVVGDDDDHGHDHQGDEGPLDRRRRRRGA